MMSVMCRLELEYFSKYGSEPDPAWPKKLVAKMTPPSVQARILGEALDLFHTEAEYYCRGMPELTGMQAPTIFCAGHGGFGRYLVLMEDMAPRKCGDQVLGITAQQAVSAVRAAARFNCKYRNRVITAEETKDLVLRQDNESYYASVADTYKKAVLTLNDDRFEFFGCNLDDVQNYKEFMYFICENYDDAYLP